MGEATIATRYGGVCLGGNGISYGFLLQSLGTSAPLKGLEVGTQLE